MLYLLLLFAAVYASVSDLKSAAVAVARRVAHICCPRIYTPGSEKIEDKYRVLTVRCANVSCTFENDISSVRLKSDIFWIKPPFFATIALYDQIKSTKGFGTFQS